MVLRLDDKNLTYLICPQNSVLSEAFGVTLRPLSGLIGNKPQVRPCGRDISLRERLLPCRAMLLADCICISLEQPLSLVAVGCLQGGKHSDVAGLGLMGGVRGEATQDDVVFEIKLRLRGSRASRSRHKSAPVIGPPIHSMPVFIGGRCYLLCLVRCNTDLKETREWTLEIISSPGRSLK